MGLDMYLYASEYVSRDNYNRESDEFTPDPAFDAIVSAIGASDKIYRGTFGGGLSIDLPMGYWRKANAIHGWFVNECGEGVDECQRIFVSEDKLRELLDLCKQVKANHDLAPELLPHTQGFFFGSYGYDDWYFQDIDSTIEILTNALNSGYSYFIYQASW